MPLRDHFQAESNRSRWGPVHGAWPTTVAFALNRILPEQFVAHPEVDIGTLEIDLAAFEGDPTGGVALPESGGVALAEPMTILKTDVQTWDDFETRIYRTDDGDMTLVAALEFVSPSNKDRAKHRKEFVDECVRHVKSGVSIAIVDVVTNRQTNLWGLLQEAIETRRTAVSKAKLYAVSCRMDRTDNELENAT